MFSAATRILFRYFGLERCTRWCRLWAGAVFVASFQPAWGAETPTISCIAPVPLHIPTPSLEDLVGLSMHSAPGPQVFIRVGSRLFLARVGNDKVRFDPLSAAGMGEVDALHDFPDFGPLVSARKGLFTLRVVDGEWTPEPVSTADIGGVFYTHDLGGAGMLFHTDRGLFLARVSNGAMHISAAFKQDIGKVSVSRRLRGVGLVVKNAKGVFVVEENAGKLDLVPAVIPASLLNAGIDVIGELAGAGTLIRARGGAYYLVRRVGRQTLVESAPIEPADTAAMGTSEYSRDIPGAGILALTDRGFFLARMEGAKIRIQPVDTARLGEVHTLSDALATNLLVGADKGLFRTQLADGRLTMERVGDVDTGPVFSFRELRDIGVLIHAAKGLFVARPAEGGLEVQHLGAIKRGGEVSLNVFPEVGVLASAPNELLMVTANSGKVNVQRAEVSHLGKVAEVRHLAGVGMLIYAEHGLFVAQLLDGKLRVLPLGTRDTDSVYDVAKLPGGSLLIHAAGWFHASNIGLDRADVKLANRKALTGIDPDQNVDRNFDFSIAHPCSTALDELGLGVRLIDPDGQARTVSPDMIRITPGEESGKVSIRAIMDAPGKWKFQMVATQAGLERNIGKVQEFAVRSPGWLERLKTLGAGIAVLLVAMNIALLFAARRSAWAWRLATDDSLSTAALRFGTLAIRHLRWPQLWILDLYFQKMKGALKEPARFLPLPLEGRDGTLDASDIVTAPPWQGRHLWIQGNSGMGKTTLFRQVTAMHFRDNDSSFAAFRRWECVVVAFPARDFADGGDDKPEPDWVIKGIKGTLARAGLSFEDDKTLRKILESGTIAVAIDSLHEADRTNAVNAFVRDFPCAPLFVTSQMPAEAQFACWRLPGDMRAFTRDLLRLHLSEADTETVMGRIGASGLKDAIRSGYDLRLIVDLVRKDPAHAPLPTDRAGLYLSVVNAAWPAGTPDEVAEQQLRTAAAAWTMVSGRKPHEDIRRMRPGDGLGDLLERLALAPEREGKPIRLVRRVGTAYEFVHDQMHAYMAARWFTQDGFEVEALMKMLEASTIWSHPKPARSALWSFIVALLDDARLCALWDKIEEIEEWDSLRRQLKDEAQRRGLARQATPRLAPEPQ